MLGKLNLGSLMKGAKKMQEMMEKNQEELANTQVTGESGAGLVRITINGHSEVKKVDLADELMTESKEIIEDLIAAAITSATQKVAQLAKNKMSDMTHLFSEDLEEDKE